MRPALGLTALLIGATLGAGCQTIRPGTPDRYADCDRRIAQYGKAQPGRLNPEEWGQRDWDGMRGAWDKNGDRRIQFAELAHRSEPPSDAWERKSYDAQARNFRHLDRAAKGYLDRDDLVASARGTFRKLDRDRDGWLSRDECAAIHPRPIDLV